MEGFRAPAVSCRKLSPGKLGGKERDGEGLRKGRDERRREEGTDKAEGGEALGWGM